MPKGRNFAPETSNDGIWFNHRGLSDTGPQQRKIATETGLMLSGPYTEDIACYPPQPPSKYTDRNTKNFKKSNNFSAHDNRHSHQDHGSYFGNGKESRFLGRRLTAPIQRQHFTSKEYLKHFGRHIINHDYHSIYRVDFDGNQSTEGPAHRRFPRAHKEGNDGLATLNTTTTKWFREPDVPYQTPLQVLASSQEPFLKANRWKYSNHGLTKCYPPYDKQVDLKNPFPIWSPISSLRKDRPLSNTQNIEVS